MSEKTWVMECADGDWQSDPFEVAYADPGFRIASEGMARHVLGAHDGDGSTQMVLRRTADLLGGLDAD